MENIKLIRIDSRLIHGQVITNWVQRVGVNNILIIDDSLASDDFMKDIYMMAAPPGMPVKVYSVEDAVNQWEPNEKQVGNWLILLKDVKTAAKLHELNFEMKQIQIGGLPSGPGRKTVYKTIALGEDDFAQLDKLNADGVTITIQMLPEEEAMSYEKAKQKNR